MRSVAAGSRDSMAVVMQTQDFPVLPSGLAEVNKMIKEHGDLFSDSHCKVCSAVLISESQKLTHYQSKKHANKVRRFLSIQGEKEPETKKFKAPSSDVAPPKNLQPLGAAPSPVATKGKDDPSVATATGGNNNNNNNPDRFCSICQASFNNPLMAQQHYVGKKHRKQMTKLKLLETYGPSTVPASTLKGYPCAICNIELNSVDQYQSHISGAKHKNQVKRAGLNTAKQQPAPEPPASGQNQLAATAEQFAVGDGTDPFSGGDSQYSEEYQYT